MGAGVAHHHFILGAEESYGYLIGTHVRDKDAIIASALICEAALQLKLKSKHLSTCSMQSIKNMESIEKTALFYPTG